MQSRNRLNPMAGVAPSGGAEKRAQEIFLIIFLCANKMGLQFARVA